MVAMAWISAPTAPKMIAAIKPIQGPCCAPIMPPAQAPIIIMPSRPIFTTPERSENKPPRPARAIGTESNSAAEAVPMLVKSEAPVSMRIIESTKINSAA